MFIVFFIRIHFNYLKVKIENFVKGNYISKKVY